MASFYIPMALSLSANLAHLPPIHGLYSFAIQPLVHSPALSYLGSSINVLSRSMDCSARARPCPLALRLRDLSSSAQQSPL